MENNTERNDRILVTLHKLAKEGATQGERDAARSRIKAIEDKVKPIDNLSYVQDALDRLTRINIESENKKRAAEEKQREQKQKEMRDLGFECETQKEKKSKPRTKRNKQDSIWKMRKFEARANYINMMIQDIIK